MIIPLIIIVMSYFNTGIQSCDKVPGRIILEKFLLKIACYPSRIRSIYLRSNKLLNLNFGAFLDLAILELEIYQILCNQKKY